MKSKQTAKKRVVNAWAVVNGSGLCGFIEFDTPLEATAIFIKEEDADNYVKYLGRPTRKVRCTITYTP